MLPRSGAALLLLTAVVGCAGATTMRVAQDDSDSDSGVSLAPAPTGAPDSSATDSLTTDSITTSSAGQPSPARDQASTSQGYAGYGNPDGNQSALEIRRIGQWTRTGIGESRRLVIRDANTWAAFWSELAVGDRPAVDFTRDVVVAVAAGQRPTGGYEIVINNVSVRAGDLSVEVLETTPGPNCMTSAALTQPVDVVVVPAVNVRGWSFIEKKDIRGCR